MASEFTPRITVFHCINVSAEGENLISAKENACELKFVKLPCSSLVKDVFLLRAFEAGADAVVVAVCPEGACRYVEGNLRAKKRVGWLKGLLDQIGLGGDRLALFNLAPGNADAADGILKETLGRLADLGPNPAA